MNHKEHEDHKDRRKEPDQKIIAANEGESHLVPIAIDLRGVVAMVRWPYDAMPFAMFFVVLVLFVVKQRWAPAMV